MHFHFLFIIWQQLYCAFRGQYHWTDDSMLMWSTTWHHWPSPELKLRILEHTTSNCPTSLAKQLSVPNWPLSVSNIVFLHHIFFQFHKFVWSQWNASKNAIGIKVSFPVTSYFSEFDALCMVMLCSPLQILKKLDILQICWLTSARLKIN